MKTVLYIAGAPHCGSTILDILLGAAPAACSTGELENIHTAHTCSCGQSLAACPHWGPILADPRFPPRPTLERLSALNQKEQGFTRTMLSRRLCQVYATAQDRIYDAVFESTDARVLIDSSKYLTRAVALLRSSQYQIRVLHLIRDPRGYLNSLNKRRREKQQPEQMTVGMLKWLSKNAAASTIVRAIAGRDRYVSVPYEHLLLQPERSFKRIGAFANLDVGDIVHRIQHDVPFERPHLFAGNRLKRAPTFSLDAQQIQANRLRGYANNRFWYTIGWPSALWGYERVQSYLTATRS